MSDNNGPKPDTELTDLTPEELAAIYAKLKAESVPPTEEEVKRLVEKSIYTIDDLQQFLDSLKQALPSETP